MQVFTEVFLDFFFHHLETIIMALAVTGFAVGGMYLIYNVFFVKKTANEGLHNAAEIEELLKKVLAQADNIGAGKKSVLNSSTESSEKNGEVAIPIVDDGGDIDSGNVNNNDAELSALKEQLSEKQFEIETLKKELEGKVSNSSEPSPELLEKINDLEARLAEYEIIEDDIADLSKYKEENARLKDEIEQLKSGGVSNASDNEPEVVEDIEEGIEEDLIEESSRDNEVEAEPVANDDPITDDLINEFEQAVNEQLGLATKEEESEFEDEEKQIGDEIDLSSSTSVDDDNNSQNDEVKTQSAQVQVIEEDGGADDIFGEFVPDEESTTKTTTASGNVNTDKMLEEISDLSEVDAGDGVSALDQDLDVEKMASEAQELDNKG
ncbi:MAG: hypothetical protein KDD58_12615 [Bdellovibrionales bacterium]|nr:hypothetical protein [Bdellovibrionales bacterium]